MKKLIFMSFSVFLILSHHTLAFGYDDQITHRDLTTSAVKNSTLKNYLFQYLGPEFAKNYESKINGNQIIEWIKKGSIDEDAVLCRRASHFHNPLLPWDQSYISDVPWSNMCVKYSAITLATRYLSPPPSGQKTEVHPWYRHWDYARATYYEALTATDKALHSSTFADTFITLGHVLHLLQDMGVPAHTRNDFASHLINGQKQPYEYFVREKPTLVTEANDGPSFTNTKLTDFWDTDKYNGSNPSTLTDIGLAEFSNANYLSDFTIPNNNPTPAHQFPYPYLSTSNVSGPSYQICPQVVAPGIMQKYISRKKDGQPCPSPTNGSAIDHFAAAGIFFGYPDSSSVSNVWLDDNVHKQYAQELLPRTVGYSAALLDYFFRGTLEISTPDRCLYGLIDGAGEQKFKKIKAKVKNTTPNEAFGSGTLTAVARYKKRTDYQPDLSTDPPKAASDNPPTEATVEPDFSYSVSVPITLTETDVMELNTTRKEFSFDFNASPIPAGITDLYLHVVFKGTLGNEIDNAVAVGMIDLSEPTHFNIWNTTDYWYYYGLVQPSSENDKVTLSTKVSFCPTNVNPWPPSDESEYNAQYFPMQPGQFARLITITDAGLEAYFFITYLTVPNTNPAWEVHGFPGMVYQDGIYSHPNNHLLTFRGKTTNYPAGYAKYIFNDGNFWTTEWPMVNHDALPAYNFDW